MRARPFGEVSRLACACALLAACGGGGAGAPTRAPALSSALAPPPASAPAPASSAPAPVVVDDRVECVGSRCVVGEITPRAKAILEAQPVLRDVRIELRAGSGDAAVRSLPALPWLTRLTLRDLHGARDLGPLAFLVALKSLSLAGLPRVRTLAPLRALVHLEQLDVVGLPSVADADASVFQAMRELRRLSLDVPKAMVDLRAIGALPALEVLAISGAVSDLSWLAGAPSLRTVVVGDGVAPGAADALSKARPTIAIRPAAGD